MPSPGLALVGFMDQQQAINFLLGACVPPNPSIPALTTEWQAAVAKIGPPMQGAGHPNVLPIPTTYQPYIDALTSEPWVAEALAGMPNSEFRLVEADKLLAMQFSVDLGRSDHHCATVGSPPNVEDMLPICLPNVFVGEQINMSQLSNSILLKSPSLNVRTVAHGFFQDNNRIGIQFGMSLPLLHVVQLNGRHYLHNGFHRAVGLRLKGATHLPCLVRTVSTPLEAGIKADGSTFTLDLLESANPPTLGHFTEGRALDVQLKRTTRILHVSWAEYGIPDE